MTRWSDDLTKKYQTRRPNKFGAQKVSQGGRTYDSKGEHAFHGMLLLLERAGEIRDIVHHPAAVQLTRYVTYKPDFVWFEIKRQIQVYGEFKGMLGERYRIIKNLWREFGPYPLQEWKRNGERFFMTEEIEGKTE